LEEPRDFKQQEQVQDEEDSFVYFKKIKAALPGSKISAKDKNYYS
jgi:hypothetical protein